jgi:hypothetical protein
VKEDILLVKLQATGITKLTLLIAIIITILNKIQRNSNMAESIQDLAGDVEREKVGHIQFFSYLFYIPQHTIIFKNILKLYHFLCSNFQS